MKFLSSHTAKILMAGVLCLSLCFPFVRATVGQVLQVVQPEQSEEQDEMDQEIEVMGGPALLEQETVIHQCDEPYCMDSVSFTHSTGKIKAQDNLRRS
jgi:hypothetical protein